MPPERWVATTPLTQRVRLSEDGWLRKILPSHPELGANPRYEEELRRTLEDPDLIVEGWADELLALRWCPIAPRSPKHLCVVYRVAEPVGFVITAFFISRYGKLMRRKVRWQKAR